MGNTTQKDCPAKEIRIIHNPLHLASPPTHTSLIMSMARKHNLVEFIRQQILMSNMQTLLREPHQKKSEPESEHLAQAEVMGTCR